MARRGIEMPISNAVSDRRQVPVRAGLEAPSQVGSAAGDDVPLRCPVCQRIVVFRLLVGTYPLAQLAEHAIRSRQRVGLRRARDAGISLGRPPARFNRNKAFRLQLQLSLRAIARHMGVPRAPSTTGATMTRKPARPRSAGLLALFF